MNLDLSKSSDDLLQEEEPDDRPCPCFAPVSMTSSPETFVVESKFSDIVVSLSSMESAAIGSPTGTCSEIGVVGGGTNGDTCAAVVAAASVQKCSAA